MFGNAVGIFHAAAPGNGKGDEIAEIDIHPGYKAGAARPLNPSA